MQGYLDLVIPGLCGPLPELSELKQSQSLQSIISLLAKAKKHKTNLISYPEQLCSLLGVEGHSIASAELALLAHEIDNEGCYWMHADPVHMMADVDHVLLYDSKSLKLSMDESESLVSNLNNHFKSDGVEFVIADANQWFVKSNKKLSVTTNPLSNAVMQNINQLMPHGQDSVFCKQLMNESQMLLFNSQVNHSRENEGLLTANSVWLWGEGVLAQPHKSSIQHCFGDNVLLQGLSKHHGIDNSSLTLAESFNSQIDVSKSNLIVIDDLMSACDYGDIPSWQATFEPVYEVLMPLIEYALSHGLCVRVYPCNGYQYDIYKTSKYQFWKTGTLEKHFESSH